MIEPGFEATKFHAALDTGRDNPASIPKQFMQTSFVAGADGALLAESKATEYASPLMLRRCF